MCLFCVSVYACVFCVCVTRRYLDTLSDAELHSTDRSALGAVWGPSHHLHLWSVRTLIASPWFNFTNLSLAAFQCVMAIYTTMISNEVYRILTVFYQYILICIFFRVLLNKSLCPAQSSACDVSSLIPVFVYFTSHLIYRSLLLSLIFLQSLSIFFRFSVG